MERPPKTQTPTLILILLNAAFWLVYALITILTSDKADSISYVARWIFAFLAIGTSIVLVVLFFLLAILSLTDQVGWWDVFSLLISAVPIVLLLKDCKWYLRLQ